MTLPRQAAAGALWIEPPGEDADDVLRPMALVRDVNGDFVPVLAGPGVTPAADLRDWGGGAYEVLPLDVALPTLYRDADGNAALDATGATPADYMLIRDPVTQDFNLVGILPGFVAGATLRRDLEGNALVLPVGASSATFLLTPGGDFMLHEDR